MQQHGLPAREPRRGAGKVQQQSAPGMPRQHELLPNMQGQAPKPDDTLLNMLQGQPRAAWRTKHDPGWRICSNHRVQRMGQLRCDSLHTGCALRSELAVEIDAGQGANPASRDSGLSV